MEDQDRDEEGYCGVCKLRKLHDRFPFEFRAWVENLKRLYLWQKAGYPLAVDELTFADMNALAQLSRYYEVKDQEAMIRSIGLPG